MALQGTIDTFPLTDVLTLLASSSRSGRLTLSGDRGSGTVWIQDQSVVGGELADGRTVSADRAVFELLRFEEGSFNFESVESDDFPAFDVAANTVEECIDTARTMLGEWAAIEALVPSVRHRVDLAPELPAEKFTVDRALWRVLVVTAKSASVSELSDALGVDDYEGSALVASMVNEGLVEVGEPWDLDELIQAQRHAPADESSTGQAELQPAIDLSDQTEADSGSTGFPDHFPIDDLISSEDSDDDSPWVPISEDLADGAVGEDPSFDGWDELVDTHGGEVDPDHESDAAEEVLRQMSKLSPKAAEAIAAALGTAETDSGVGTNGALGSDFADGNDTEDPTATEPGPISFLDSF